MIKIHPTIPVTWKAYNPDKTFLGYLNIYEFNDLRIQIAKEQASGYYMIFEDRKIIINPTGTCDGWPNGFYDQLERQYRELLNLKKPKTSEQWQSIYPMPRILDPDGWDRENSQYSWHEELISHNEYQQRLIRSTLIETIKII